MFKRFRVVSSLFKQRFTTFAVLAPTVFAKNETENAHLKRPDFRECIKHACLLNVNAASSLLTATLFSIDLLVEKYKTAMTSLTGLLEECVLMNGWNDELWDSVIALRSETNQLKLEIDKLIIYFETANKVATASIEAAFNIDANYLCTTLCEHSHSAEEKIKELETLIKNLEDEYLIASANVAKYQKLLEEN